MKHQLNKSQFAATHGEVILSLALILLLLLIAVGHMYPRSVVLQVSNPPGYFTKNSPESGEYVPAPKVPDYESSLYTNDKNYSTYEDESRKMKSFQRFDADQDGSGDGSGEVDGRYNAWIDENPTFHVVSHEWQSLPDGTTLYVVYYIDRGEGGNVPGDQEGAPADPKPLTAPAEEPEKKAPTPEPAKSESPIPADKAA
jgi:hypothetical protein